MQGIPHRHLPIPHTIRLHPRWRKTGPFCPGIGACGMPTVPIRIGRRTSRFGGALVRLRSRGVGLRRGDASKTVATIGCQSLRKPGQAHCRIGTGSTLRRPQSHGPRRRSYPARARGCTRSRARPHPSRRGDALKAHVAALDGIVKAQVALEAKLSGGQKAIMTAERKQTHPGGHPR